jgi:YVTN family beta-propeller protein
LSIVFLFHLVVDIPYPVEAQYRAMAKYNTSNFFIPYEDPTLGIKINYPFNWTLQYNEGEGYRFVQFFVPQDPPVYYLEIKLSPLEGRGPLLDLTGKYISYFKQIHSNFNLVDNYLTRVDNILAYKTIFTYRSNNTDFKNMQFLLIHGENVYEIRYSAEAKGYDKWLGIMQNMINSLEIRSTLYTNPEIPEIGLKGIHNDLAVDSKIDTVYIVDYNENRLYAIIGSDNKKQFEIPISSPSGIAVDNIENSVPGILFVANKENNTISLITRYILNQYRLETVPVGAKPLDIDVNPITNRIYVANSGSNSVSVIDYTINYDNYTIQTTALDNVNVEVFPSHLSVNPITNRIYVANSGSNSVSVIDGSINKVIDTIPVGNVPSNTALNPFTNRIYVANSGSDNSSSNFISVINGSTNRILENISVGFSSFGGQQMAIDPNDNTVYVTDFYSDYLYVVSESTNRLLKNVSVLNPSSIGIDMDTNDVYVENLDSHRTYIINGLTYEVINDPLDQAIVSVNIPSSNSGQIICDTAYPLSPRIEFDKGKQLICEAVAEKGFVFDRWEVDDKPVENSTEDLNMTVSNSIRLSATFREVIPLWTNPIIMTIIIFGIIVSMGHLLHWRIVRFRQKRLLRKQYKM